MDWMNVEPDVYRLINKHYTPGRGGQQIKYIVRHHNAGILTIDGCWQVWQTREASAHYQVENSGRIGQLVAERLAAFGMRVVAYDPVWDREASIRIGVEYADLDELVAHSDVVTIHVPRTEATRALFDARRLAGAKPGQILVNASRGGVVDERALADALRDGPLRAAGIDVFEEEPPADSPLLACGNVVLTPHLGASTREAQLRAGEAAVDAVLRALRGEGADVPGAVNAEALARQ